MDKGTQYLNSKRHAKSVRDGLRLHDIQESKSLLLELALYEPNITSCFNVLINACLAEDIKLEVKGRKITKEFDTHLNIYYNSFCVEAIKCMYIYGFVPWHPRKLSSGDVIPTILPHGTFSWTVKTLDENDSKSRKKDEKKELNTEDRKQRESKPDAKPDTKPDTKPDRKPTNTDKKDAASDTYAARRWKNLPLPYTDNGSKEVQYVVELLHTSIEAEDVYVFETSQANLHVNTDSNLYATVISPLSHILVDYKNLREALLRKSHADAWNTTARVFTSCAPPVLQNSEPTNSYLYFETGSDLNRITTGRYYMDNRHKEIDKQISQPSNHVPTLYNLPLHHKLEQLAPLNPCEDIEFLLEKYRRDCCALIGVPYDMIYGNSQGGQETSGRSMMTSRVFGKTIRRMCTILENLMRDAYCTIYGEDHKDVIVSLNPMPRLDISTIEDIKILWEMGAVTPDVVAQLSEILLVSGQTNLTGKFRDTTHGPNTYKRNLVDINKALKPPNPTASKGVKKKTSKKTSAKKKKKKSSTKK